MKETAKTALKWYGGLFLFGMGIGILKDALLEEAKEQAIEEMRCIMY